MLNFTVKFVHCRREIHDICQHIKQATGWDSIPGTGSNFYVGNTRRKQGFQNSRNTSKTVVTRRMTRSKFCTDDLQVLGAIIQNLFARDLSIPWLGSIHPDTFDLRYSHCKVNTGACGSYLQHSKEWEEHVSVR